MRRTHFRGAPLRGDNRYLESRAVRGQFRNKTARVALCLKYNNWRLAVATTQPLGLRIEALDSRITKLKKKCNPGARFRLPLNRSNY